MQVTMLISAIKKTVPYNLRRVATCVAYKNRIRTRMTRCRSEQSLLSTFSLPNFPTYRIYSTEPDSEPRVTLPMLVDRAPMYIPSLLTALKLLYFSLFKINPYIDKEFDITEFLKGAKYATTVISKALTNKNYESLEGLVAEDVIETLKAKIETLTPNQRQLISVNEDDMLFYVLSDIDVTVGDEHSIKITITCHYIPDFAEKKEKLMSSGLIDFSKLGHLVCNYTFVRKYVNNVGGPWIATFVNHYTV